MSTLMLLAQANSGGALAIGGFALVLIIVALLASIFWLWMLVDALMNEPTAGEKLLWFVVIFFLHILGAIIYFVVRRSGHSRPALR